MYDSPALIQKGIAKRVDREIRPTQKPCALNNDDDGNLI